MNRSCDFRKEKQRKMVQLYGNDIDLSNPIPACRALSKGTSFHMRWGPHLFPPPPKQTPTLLTAPSHRRLHTWWHAPFLPPSLCRLGLAPTLNLTPQFTLRAPEGFLPRRLTALAVGGRRHEWPRLLKLRPLSTAPLASSPSKGVLELQHCFVFAKGRV